MGWHELPLQYSLVSVIFRLSRLHRTHDGHDRWPNAEMDVEEVEDGMFGLSEPYLRALIIGTHSSRITSSRAVFGSLLLHLRRYVHLLVIACSLIDRILRRS